MGWGEAQRCYCPLELQREVKVQGLGRGGGRFVVLLLSPLNRHLPAMVLIWLERGERSAQAVLPQDGRLGEAHFWPEAPPAANGERGRGEEGLKTTLSPAGMDVHRIKAGGGEQSLHATAVQPAQPVAQPQAGAAFPITRYEVTYDLPGNSATNRCAAQSIQVQFANLSRQLQSIQRRGGRVRTIRVTG